MEPERSSWDDEEDHLDKFWAEDQLDACVGFASDPHYSASPTTQLSPVFNLQEVDSGPLLGLKLNKTAVFMSLLKMRVSPPMVSQPNSSPEKLKASNFQITEIKVGAWRRVSMREGDLTAKLYFAKRKLVWEILDGHLKSKMEILWSDITAIKAVMLQNQPGILQIEIDKPPLFFREIAPEARKHTTWHQVSDFTGGQAPYYRRHAAIFPEGALDKHYEKLIQCDQHLFELSQKPFPSHECPFFNTGLPLDLPLNFNGPGPSYLPLAQHYPYPLAAAYPTTPSILAPPNPPIAVNTPNRNEGARNFELGRQRGVWGAERMRIPWPPNPYFEEQPPPTGNHYQVFPAGHNYPLNNLVVLNQIENHLLGESQIVHSNIDEELAQMQQMNGSLFVNPMINNNNIGINHSGLMGQCYQMSDDVAINQVIKMENEADWLPSPPLQMETQVLNNCFLLPSDNEDLFSAMYPNQRGNLP